MAGDNIFIDIDFSSFDDDMTKALIGKVAARCKQIAYSILPPIVELVGAGMKASPEYASLATGLLREEFGLGVLANGSVDGQTAADSVVEAVQASIRVDTIPPDDDDLGGVFIGIFKGDFSDAMSAKWASYTSKGIHLVPWLQWLLFEGDAVVLTGVELLRDYPVRKVSARKASRTGKVIMVRRDYDTTSSSIRGGGSAKAFGRYNAALGRTAPGVWRVPPEFSGTESSNWLTKVADVISPQVESLLITEGKSA